VAAIPQRWRGVSVLRGSHDSVVAVLGLALDWYMGDTIGLLSVAPFLLIHVLPWIGKWDCGFGFRNCSRRPGVGKKQSGNYRTPDSGSHRAGGSFGLLFWIMFGVSDSRQLFYQHSSPLSDGHAARDPWSGHRVACAEFGIVVTLRFVPVSAETFTKLGLLMLQSPPPD